MPYPQSLLWVRGSANGWCKLLELNLGLIHTHGVYVIWHGGFPSRVLKVGYGDIATELADRCRDHRILAYMKYGALFVTWASVGASDAAGVARHLADTLRPLVEDRAAAADVPPIAANVPFPATTSRPG
jgi:hypothetical protein